MRATNVALAALLLAQLLAARAQDGGFELPVQLIGFPVIIFAVRASNFVKKLAYSLNPRTYVRRSARSVDGPQPHLDLESVEKRMVAEFGESVCVYENVCDEYAEKVLATNNHVLDWDTVFNAYKELPADSKQSYLLSVFLGDIVASPKLCRELTRRRPCQR
ncbi:uncharacterized protein LOC124722949 [Schistocerca piceifrons]|uniref:uncharacterized protein LOC124722949 n=1 Tax=Schistocerca piceifrons TaxID=274613 RepID=UPI001F5F1FE7|nr:uncharacterized protein LOC124722949 [Schistocerca piceifrons]XP_049847281.1 uncharacterized protein LOC126299425 [Schistocerca gregaria]